jgi:hypothetical protein
VGLDDEDVNYDEAEVAFQPPLAPPPRQTPPLPAPVKEEFRPAGYSFPTPRACYDD